MPLQFSFDFVDISAMTFVNFSFIVVFKMMSAKLNISLRKKGIQKLAGYLPFQLKLVLKNLVTDATFFEVDSHVLLNFGDKFVANRTAFFWSMSFQVAFY